MRPAGRAGAFRYKGNAVAYSITILPSPITHYETVLTERPFRTKLARRLGLPQRTRHPHFLPCSFERRHRVGLWVIGAIDPTADT